MNTTSGKTVVVTGATGNVGTSVVRLLSEDPRVESVRALARRVPAWAPPGVEWTAADLAQDVDPAPLFEGADAVVHLAWRFQPARDPAVTWRANVLGSIRVFDAVVRARVPALVHASSVGAYSPGSKNLAVDESWPTDGWPEAAYSREKAYLERVLDTYELEHPDVRVVRMRPAFLFKKESAGQQRRIFGGRLAPGPLIRPELLPFLPDVPGLQVQALHSDDAAQAYVLAALHDADGAFNLAADPPLDARVLGDLFHSRTVRLPSSAARTALAAAWRLHLVPASPELFETVLRIPLMDCTVAHTELGWHPEHNALDAVTELVHGMRHGTGAATPPLADRTAG